MSIANVVRISALIVLTNIFLTSEQTSSAEDLPKWSEPKQITKGIEVNSVQFLATGELLLATNVGIVTVNLDGTPMRTLFKYKDIQRANMSPDGTKIVVDNDLDIFTANPDGSEFKPIANDPDIFEFAVSFTPDGKKINFVTIDDVNTVYGIWNMGPDGSNKKNLLSRSDIAFRHPRLSPAGTRISYFSVGKGKKPRIWVMEKDGQNSVALTNPDEDGISRQASWSSDGKKFAYASRKYGDFDIWTMNTDGSNKRRITSIPGDEAKPVWSRDGRSIVFVCSDCRGAVGSDLYIISRK